MRAPFFLHLAMLALWRSWRTSLVVSFLVFSSVAMLVFLSALAVGTNDAMVRNATGLYSGQIMARAVQPGALPSLSRLQMPGVAHILPRRSLRVLLRHDGILEPLELIGIEPERELQVSALAKKTVAGVFPARQGREIYLNQASAKQLRAGPGSQVAVRGPDDEMLSFTVAGIYATGVRALDFGLAFCPAAALPSHWPTTLSLGIFLQDGQDAEAMAARLQELAPTAAFTPWTAFMPDLQQLIELEYICMAIVLVLVFAIVAVGISCTFLIFTMKNLREHGIMKAMGVRASETALLLSAQIGLLTLLASCAGALAGAMLCAIFAANGIDISAFTSHNQYFAVSGLLYPRLTWLALAASPALAVCFGLLAAAWPVAHVMRANPAEILRSF